jgi:hypothetical protein
MATEVLIVVGFYTIDIIKNNIDFCERPASDNNKRAGQK